MLFGKAARRAYATTFFGKSDDITSTQDTKKGDTSFESCSIWDINAQRGTTTL